MIIDLWVSIFFLPRSQPNCRYSLSYFTADHLLSPCLLPSFLPFRAHQSAVTAQLLIVMVPSQVINIRLSDMSGTNLKLGALYHGLALPSLLRSPLSLYTLQLNVLKPIPCKVWIDIRPRPMIFWVLADSLCLTRKYNMDMSPIASAGFAN
jgi:hypothetical protein